MKDSLPVFEYLSKSGFVTVFSMPSTGLMHWHAGNLPPEPEENKKVIAEWDDGTPMAVVGSRRVPGPYGETLTTAVVAMCERLLNKTPPVQPKPPKINPDRARKLYAAGDPAVTAYEIACMQVLEWLRDQGEIMHIKPRY